MSGWSAPGRRAGEVPGLPGLEQAGRTSGAGYALGAVCLGQPSVQGLLGRGVALPGQDGGECGELADASPGMAVGGGVDGLLGVGPGGGQVAEGPQCVGMLGLTRPACT